MGSVSKSVSIEAVSQNISPTRLDGIMKCNYCPKTFMVHESLEKHIKRNHSGKNIVESIPALNMKGQSVSSAQNVKQSEGTKASSSVCAEKSIIRTSPTDVCNKHGPDGFQEPSNAKKIKTSFKSGIRCLYCPYNHPSINAVRAHITFAHSREVEKPRGISMPLESKDKLPKKVAQFTLKCTKDSNCNFSTTSLQSLKAHHIQKHTKTLLPCPLCFKKFVRHPDLTRHILMDHSGIPQRKQVNGSNKITSYFGSSLNPQSIVPKEKFVEEKANQISSDKVEPSATKEYPFDFDFLKAYLKVFTFVKQIVDTTNDAQLKAEILKKDKYNLLGRNESDVSDGKNQDSLPKNGQSENSVQESSELQDTITKNNTSQGKLPSSFEVNIESLSIQDPVAIDPVEEAIAKIKSFSGMEVFSIKGTSGKEAEITSPINQTKTPPSDKNEVQGEKVMPTKPGKRMTAKQFRSFRRSRTPIPET